MDGLSSNAVRYAAADVMIVYKITDIVTGKGYVGVTRHPAPTRWKTHRAYAKRGSKFPIHRALAKHGIARFRFDVLCECSSLAELAVCERGLIAAHGTYTPHGYNITSGGEGCFERVVTDATRQKLSRSIKAAIAEGRLAPPRQPKGYRHSDETKLKISKNHRAPALSDERRARLVAAWSGENNPLNRDLDARRRSAENRRGQKRTPEQCARISEGCKRRRPRRSLERI